MTTRRGDGSGGDSFGLPWRRLAELVEQSQPDTAYGRVEKIVGPLVEARGPAVRLGEACWLETPVPGAGVERIPVEVVGFRGDRNLLMPLDRLGAVDCRSVVVPTGAGLRVPVGEAYVGRVLDGLGRPMDGADPPEADALRPVDARPPDPMARPRICEVMPLGIRAIDACLTCGRGQRVGIFAGSGVGKSTLLGMIARHARSRVNVIALVGERGREVRDFIERDLGAGLARSVVVVATSAEPPLLRTRAAMTAMAHAEYFRDRGHDVLLMMDSLSRLALAQREIGLALGEQATTRGFTPSVFSLLPELLERSGTAPTGSITGIYTVLVEGDDMEEPVADAARGLLDGHVVLSRKKAEARWFPAIDVPASVSRVARELVETKRRVVVDRLRELLATHAASEDLLRLGAYQAGSDPALDEAVARHPALRAFLTQDVEEHVDWDETWKALEAVFAEGTTP